MMASMGVDAEAEMEELFAQDEAEEPPGTQSLTQEEAERAGQANLDVTGAGDVKKKRIIKNPQPKLNPERLMGPRGIQTIEDYFQGWESKGKGKEFDDLDVIMKQLEHWAHRLYPKLPFDNVIDVVANRLGKKKTVQTHMKKIRLGMVTAPVHVGGGDNVVSDDERDVERYHDDDQPDVFQELLIRAGGGQEDVPPVRSQPVQVGGLTEEQKERIRRNREMAELKKKEKREREEREAEEAMRLQNNDSQRDDEEEIEREILSQDVEIEREMVSSSEPATHQTMNDDKQEQLDLDEMLQQ